MTDKELTHVKNLVKNTEQFNAVKAFLLQNFHLDIWAENTALSLNDAEYGQRIKVGVLASKELGYRFEEMVKLLEEKKPKDSKNEMR